MTAVALTPVISTKTGAVVVPETAAAGGNYFTNTGEQIITLFNGDSAAAT